MSGGPAKSHLASIDHESLVKNETPYALSFFPDGSGKKTMPLVICDNPKIAIPALKKSEDGNEIIVRLFEPMGKKQDAVLTFPGMGIERKISLNRFEIKTLRINAKKKTVVETDLLEG